MVSNLKMKGEVPKMSDVVFVPWYIEASIYVTRYEYHEPLLHPEQKSEAVVVHLR